MIHPEDMVFDDKAKVLQNQLKGVDLASRADILGGIWTEGTLTVSLFGRPHRITQEGIQDHEGRPPTPAVTMLLCRYLLTHHATQPSGSPEWITLRDVEGAGILTSAFTENTQKILNTAFAGHLHSLKGACAALGGIIENHPGYDLSIRFHALPRIPMLLRFNDAEAGFPAQCSIFFDRSAPRYLDLECLSIIATYLAGNLIG